MKLNGALFQNEKQNDRQPDYKGTCTDENEVKFDIAGWLKTSAKGTKYISILIKEHYQSEKKEIDLANHAKSQTTATKKVDVSSLENIDDGLPF